VSILGKLLVGNIMEDVARLAEAQWRKLRRGAMQMVVAAVVLLAALGMLLGAMFAFVFALYALLEPALGIPGSAAVCGLVAFGLAVCLAAIARSMAR
jgi:hypothetical protein